jgi:glycosyltransferase involved in cell wall biosynthesis
VAAIVLTFNEERNLPECLESLTGWVTQLFVVDSGSTDRTVAIAREFGAEVLQHPFETYGAQRNWALDHAPVTTPWVLNVDADERITPELRDSIVRAVAADAAEVTGYMMSRRTMFMGRWIRHGGHYPAWHLRLFRTGRGRCEERLYDQHFFSDGQTKKLHGDLIDTLTPNLATFSIRHVRWAQLEADEQSDRSTSPGRVRGRLVGGDAITTRRWLRERYARLPLFVRPLLYFLYRYIVRGGFLDGREGLVFHFLQGFWYRFLVDAVLFERSRATRSETTSGPEAARPGS